MSNVFTTRQLADLVGTRTWRVRRLFEDGTLPEPERFAGKRAIPGTMIPRIVDALRARGWLPPSGAVVSSAAAEEHPSEAGDAQQEPSP